MDTFQARKSELPFVVLDLPSPTSTLTQEEYATKKSYTRIVQLRMTVRHTQLLSG